jgi:hypothetical protein
MACASQIVDKFTRVCQFLSGVELYHQAHEMATNQTNLIPYAEEGSRRKRRRAPRKKTDEQAQLYGLGSP